MTISEHPLSSDYLVRREAGGTAADQVYAHLRERILTFDLPPDATLSRADLAKSYGVSQTPVREALQRLEQDGLVQIFPQSKTIVARIDLVDLRETHFYRVSLECEVVRRLATSENRSIVKDIQAILNLQKSLVSSTDQIDLFTSLDRSFHEVMFHSIGMDRMQRVMMRRMGHLTRCQFLELPMTGKMEWIVAGHQAIIDGIASNDPAAATTAMREHISGTIKRISALRDQFPDYFVGQ